MTGLPDNETVGGEFTRKAVTLLAVATALQGTLHLPGVRDDYRSRLEQVVLVATKALESAMENGEVELLHWVLVQACAARAEDARYGAGQLARGSQRAPPWKIAKTAGSVSRRSPALPKRRHWRPQILPGNWTRTRCEPWPKELRLPHKPPEISSGSATVPIRSMPIPVFVW